MEQVRFNQQQSGHVGNVQINENIRSREYFIKLPSDIKDRQLRLAS